MCASSTLKPVTKSRNKEARYGIPKRARTVNWESGVLTLDGEKQFEVPELTVEIMEQLAGYTLVGFYVKSYPVTDELLAPFCRT